MRARACNKLRPCAGSAPLRSDRSGRADARCIDAEAAHPRPQPSAAAVCRRLLVSHRVRPARLSPVCLCSSVPSHHHSDVGSLLCADDLDGVLEHQVHELVEAAENARHLTAAVQLDWGKWDSGEEQSRHTQAIAVSERTDTRRPMASQRQRAVDDQCGRERLLRRSLAGCVLSTDWRAVCRCIW
jgi:hypothetical protein